VTLIGEILARIEDRPADAVAVGRVYTAVRIGERVGIARSNLEEGTSREDLEALAGTPVAHLLTSADRPASAVGAAAVNALLPETGRPEKRSVFEEIVEVAPRFARIGIVGLFPFVRQIEGKVTVLEEKPEPGCLPASSAPEVLPGCDLVVITGSAFANGTLDELLGLSEGFTYVIGPSTPVTTLLFRHGVDVAAGVFCSDPDVVDVIASGQGTHAFIGRTRRVTLRRNEP
jgi:uncharacterized protein (DUF4213/DUF364 family)